MQGSRHQADYHSNHFNELQARVRNVFPAFRCLEPENRSSDSFQLDWTGTAATRTLRATPATVSLERR